ncbi:MAG: rhodanese-like domain-containing protein [Proteobacteria bacterium]|nr:rhodanese-like domain-containing protein [Pseudomonadota bacterium]
MTPAALRERLLSGAELALLDVREQGVHTQGHPFFACSLPLSRLEMMVLDLVPRYTAPIVLLDGGGEGLAERAAARLAQLGYTDVQILEGGCAAWKATGGELFSGVNVPSKAFGEFVEHHYGTPRIPPDELQRLKQSGKKLVILDSRPWDEYHRMNIPGAIDAPGAELVYRVHDLADPDTLVVVNCAGRTRSIIGCQSLRNAGLQQVVALKDGTMGWELAGFECERGAGRVAPEPTPAGREKARTAAAQVAQRFGVKFTNFGNAMSWRAESSRTFYLLDVRTRAEFKAGRIPGSVHAPGGQLVQATDEFIGVRNARVVLIDPEQVRAVMTASWLNQMGWEEVYVLEAEGDFGFGDLTLARGPRTPRIPAYPDAPAVRAAELAQRLEAGAVLIDLSSSLRFRRRHVPGAWWAVRARLAAAREKIGAAREIVLTSDDGLLARLAAPEAAALWAGAAVQVLGGGNAAWFDTGLPAETGIERATTTLDDVWYKPYDHEQEKDYEKHARAYLDWELGLVQQIKRDPAIRFRAYDTHA